MSSSGLLGLHGSGASRNRQNGAVVTTTLMSMMLCSTDPDRVDHVVGGRWEAPHKAQMSAQAGYREA